MKVTTMTTSTPKKSTIIHLAPNREQGKECIGRKEVTWLEESLATMDSVGLLEKRLTSMEKGHGYGCTKF